MNFKVGDKVICVDDSSKDYIQNNVVYTIVGVDYEEGTVLVDNNKPDADYFSWRFILWTPLVEELL